MVNMNPKQKALLVIGGIIVISIGLWWYADTFAEWMKTADPLTATIVYLLTNPDHVAVLGFMYVLKKWRGLLGGFFVIAAFDIMSWAHYITMSGAMPVEASSFVGMDTLFYRAFQPFPLGTFGLYVVVPAILLIIALEIVYPKTFITLIKRTVGTE